MIQTLKKLLRLFMSDEPPNIHCLLPCIVNHSNIIDWANGILGQDFETTSLCLLDSLEHCKADRMPKNLLQHTLLSDVPGPAWAQSPGLGWASAGSGLPILKPGLESQNGNTEMAHKINVSPAFCTRQQQWDMKVIQLLHDYGCGASLQLVQVSVGTVSQDLSIEYSDPWILRKV
jgi:hypothetical protein